MPWSFLSADVLARYGRFAGEPDAAQLAAYFHLTDADLVLIDAQSTPANRLGLGLQLGCGRFLGTFVTDLATVPPGVVAYVARQIGADEASVVKGYGRGGTATRHRQLIRDHDGYRQVSEPAVALGLARWLTERAWMADERPEVLFELAVARLRQQRVLLPGHTTLERLVSSAQARMEARLLARLAAIPTPAEREGLESVLHTDGAVGRSPLGQLRRGPRPVSVDGLRDATNRLAAARELSSSTWSLDGLPAAKITRLAHDGATLGARDLARMAHERRLGTLVAFAHTLRRTAQDDLVHLMDIHLRLVMNRADTKDRRERLRTLRALDAAVRWAAFSRVPASRIEAAVATVEATAPRTAAGPGALGGRLSDLATLAPGCLGVLGAGRQRGRAAGA